MSPQPISNKVRFLQQIRTALGQPAGRGRNFLDLFSDSRTGSSLLLNRIDDRSATDVSTLTPPPSRGMSEGGTGSKQSPVDRNPLLDRLIDESIPLNLKVIPVPTVADAAQSIVDLTLDRTPEWSDAKSLVAWRHPLIDSLNLPDRLKSCGIPVYVPDFESVDFKQFRLLAQTALIGVTSADYCIAESASLILKNRSGQPGMVSLLPSIHVAVITEDQLLDSLAKCYALIKQGVDAETEGMIGCMTLISGPSKTADIEAVMVHGAHGPREMIIFVIAEQKGFSNTFPLS
jgi:L-lactate dehydrogenase complex protein LldG